MIILTIIGGILVGLIAIGFLWALWEGFKSAVTYNLQMKIYRLEDWQNAWQPYLEQLQKEQDKKNVKKTNRNNARANVKHS